MFILYPRLQRLELGAGRNRAGATKGTRGLLVRSSYFVQSVCYTYLVPQFENSGVAELRAYSFFPSVGFCGSGAKIVHIMRPHNEKRTTCDRVLNAL